MVNTAMNPHPYNHHIYATKPPADEKLTLSGFEGPEKLLEIWFRLPTATSDENGDVRSASPVSSLGDSIHSASFSLKDDPPSDTDSINSFMPAPIHSYRTGNAHLILQDSLAVAAAADASVAEYTTDAPSTSWTYKRTGLRTIPRPIWEEMLDIVKCKVLSVINNEHADAYLLSESSMFIYPNRLMLKTCGTTTLLHAVPKILETVKEFCGIEDIDALFYSRKAFLFPEKQIYPHGKWGDEVAYLDGMFKGDSYETAGYVVGKVNGDHWCLYTATPVDAVVNEDGDELSSDSGVSTASGTTRDEGDEDEDEVTLEIMMQQLDPNVTKLFWRTEEEQREAQAKEAQASHNGKIDLSTFVNLAKQPQGIEGVHKNIRKAERRLLNDTGIQDIYPCSMVDDYLFDPCGYSLNGLLGPYYWTIHVTPEDFCSYASFETTIPVRKFYSPKNGVNNGSNRNDGVDCSEAMKKNANNDGNAKPDFRQGSASEYVNYEALIDQVLTCFKPGKFSITLFSRNSHGRKHGRGGMGLIDGQKIDGFKRVDKIVSAVGKWDMVFAHYEKSGTGIKPSNSSR